MVVYIVIPAPGRLSQPGLHSQTLKKNEQKGKGKRRKRVVVGRGSIVLKLEESQEKIRSNGHLTKRKGLIREVGGAKARQEKGRLDGRHRGLIGFSNSSLALHLSS